MLVRVSKDGTIALPETMRESLSLKIGDGLEASLDGHAIRLVPARRPVQGGVDIADWIGTGTSFSSPEEVDKSIRAGRDEWD